MTTLECVLAALVLAFFAIGIPTDIYLLRRAAGRMKTHHPQAWKNLRARHAHSAAFIQFARGGGYTRLNDPTLTALLGFKRRFDAILGYGFAISMLMLALYALAHGK